MENGAASIEERRTKASALYWHNCGPDLGIFAAADEQRMISLLYEHGEIRFRYAAHLTFSISAAGDPLQWLRLIEYACRERWLSTHTMHRMAEILQHRIWTAKIERIPIPWLTDSVDDLTRNQRAFIEEACASTEKLGPTLPFRRLYD